MGQKAWIFAHATFGYISQRPLNYAIDSRGSKDESLKIADFDESLLVQMR